MNSADYAIPFQANWSHGVAMKEKAIRDVSKPTASIIDDLVAMRESQDMIPKSEIAVDAGIRPNPLYNEPSEGGLVVARGGLVVARGVKKAKFSAANEFDSMFGNNTPLPAMISVGAKKPVTRRKKTVY